MMMSTIRVNTFGGKGRSSTILVPNKYGTWRMRGDYRALSNITIKNQYSLCKSRSCEHILLTYSLRTLACK